MLAIGPSKPTVAWLCEVDDAFGAAVAVDVGLACVDRPQRVRDLAADENVVIGVAGAERDIGIAAREIDVLVAHDELDAQFGMARVEAVEQFRLHDAVDDGFRAGHADKAGLAALDGGLALLEGERGALDLFGVGQHLLAELGQAVAGGVALHQLASELALQLGDAPLHGGLAEVQRLRRRQRAAVARHRQEVFDVVPFEHGRDYALLLRARANLRLPRA